MFFFSFSFFSCIAINRPDRVFSIDSTNDRIKKTIQIDLFDVKPLLSTWICNRDVLQDVSISREWKTKQTLLVVFFFGAFASIAKQQNLWKNKCTQMQRMWNIYYNFFLCMETCRICIIFENGISFLFFRVAFDIK